ncbi:hypothetical protein [Streptomyces sp. NPDC058683]|uniref:hypothetical protein n=1 Tax=Streptomyces sp. NPDC058683 TaxID=3346597 RepID=UPI00366687BC
MSLTAVSDSEIPCRAGCGVMAGFGAAALLGPDPAGAARRIAVDGDDREPATAHGLGSHPHRQLPGDQRRRRGAGAAGRFGPDAVIEAVGRPETRRQACCARDLAGTVVPVGVLTPEMRLELPPPDAFGTGTVALDEVEKAVERMRHGDVPRSVTSQMRIDRGF